MTKENLIHICNLLYSDPTLKPRFEDGVYKTYCNIAMNKLCSACGISLYNGLANDIIKVLINNSNWKTLEGKDNSEIFGKAQKLANQGSIVLVGQCAPGHGHIAVVYPGILQESPSFGAFVPRVFSIGDTCGDGKMSSFFKVPNKSAGIGDVMFFVWQGETYNF